MTKSNPHFTRLKREYIFPIIEQKLQELKCAHPTAQIINMGIGDVSLPLSKTVANAISNATLEMADEKHIRGYGPSEGYLFLKEAICANEYRHTNIEPGDIFISDGINSDIAGCTEIFHPSSIVAIPDPTYPVYLDSSLLAGRKVVLMPCTEKTRCLPIPPDETVDILYLCSPSNPTGEALTKNELKAFVDYAIARRAIILYDNAYSAFISSDETAKTIYEIEGADRVAIEFRSFSKSAGFTGLRCGYSVVPKQIEISLLRKKISLRQLWMKRICMKSNGVSYPIQKGAECTFSIEGRKETMSQVAQYKKTADIIREGLKTLGHTCYGGIDAPYLWWKVPNGLTSWNFFDHLLNKCHIIAIPGRGFGIHGEGFIRLSAFTKPEIAIEALTRIKQLHL